jgi:uncharacterized protein (TIGR02722 family)
MKSLTLILLGLLLLLLVACGPSVKTERISPDQQTDFGGRWNDTDANMVAQSMIKDVLSRPWYGDHMRQHNEKPVVIVGTVRLMGTEHIATDTFINDMERELINSGLVKFVASKGERGEIRDEKQDQQTNASLETAKKLAEETGADYMLQGAINTITDSVDGKKAITYQVDLQLINLQTNEKVWIGSQKIKKIVTRSKF